MGAAVPSLPPALRPCVGKNRLGARGNFACCQRRRAIRFTSDAQPRRCLLLCEHAYVSLCGTVHVQSRQPGSTARTSARQARSRTKSASGTPRSPPPPFLTPFECGGAAT